MRHDTRQRSAVPWEQQALRNTCRHPTGIAIQFPQAEVEQTISERFAQQVARYAKRLAVKTEPHALTYHELDAAANRVALALLTP